jgi:hypothetical protein
VGKDGIEPPPFQLITARRSTTELHPQDREFSAPSVMAHTLSFRCLCPAEMVHLVAGLKNRSWLSRGL